MDHTECLEGYGGMGRVYMGKVSSGRVKGYREVCQECKDVFAWYMEQDSVLVNYELLGTGADCNA
ncbi:hypothetical protein E2C01_087858 [Portunus trituberculatus]|uniref:Uncharacterized protein n=1 Tax=Portunus trituberculatus TaxID=210409 RepID=A0A5B7J993_PORTR|nr:hypothetical protein [Portunus trituberculatus]